MSCSFADDRYRGPELVKWEAEIPAGLKPVNKREHWPFGILHCEKELCAQEAALRRYLVKICGARLKKRKVQVKKRSTSAHPTPILTEKRVTKRKQYGHMNDGSYNTEEFKTPKRSTSSNANNNNNSNNGKIEVNIDDASEFQYEKIEEEEEDLILDVDNCDCKSVRERVEFLEDKIYSGCLDGSFFKDKTGFELYQYFRALELRETYSSTASKITKWIMLNNPNTTNEDTSHSSSSPTPMEQGEDNEHYDFEGTLCFCFFLSVFATLDTTPFNLIRVVVCGGKSWEDCLYLFFISFLRIFISCLIFISKLLPTELRETGRIPFLPSKAS